jgi:hypothetical protein
LETDGYKFPALFAPAFFRRGFFDEVEIKAKRVKVMERV